MPLKHDLWSRTGEAAKFRAAIVIAKEDWEKKVRRLKRWAAQGKQHVRRKRPIPGITASGSKD